MFHFTRNTSMPRNSGISLISTVCAMAIGGLVIKGAFAILVNLSSAYIDFVNKTEVNQLHTYVSRAVDCEAFKSDYPTCGIGSYVELKSISVDDSILMGRYQNNLSTAKRVGKFQMRASCQPCPDCTNGKKIYVEYSFLRGSKANNWSDLSKGKAPISCVVS